jgi:hypothetical protein
MIFYLKSTDKGRLSLHRLSVLLASASTGGTLAAARHLSANGIEAELSRASVYPQLHGRAARPARIRRRLKTNTV